jgi:signal transduction histidine kinase/DNA-binding response OmpR family regulator
MSDAPTKILLVEDNLGDAGLIKAALREDSSAAPTFDLVHAERLSEALKLLREADFGLVLLDLMLPDGSGVNNVVRVKDVAPSLPIVIMSGINDEAVAIEAMRNGAQDYLIKGEVEASLLARALRYAIERKRIETQIQQLRNQESVLREINIDLTSTLDLNSVLDALLEKIITLLPGIAATIRLKNRETGTWEPVACRNLDEQDWRRAPAIRNGSGLTETVVSAQKAVVVRNVQNHPNTGNPEFMVRNHLVTFLGIPLVVKDEILGVLGLYTRSERTFTPEQIDFFSAIGNQAAIAIHNSQLYEGIKRANERQAALYEINRAMTSSLDLGAILDSLLKKIINLRPNGAAFIRLLNHETGEMEAAACGNLDKADWQGLLSRADQGLAHIVMSARTPVAIPDVRNDPRSRHPDFNERNGLMSFLGLPLIVDEVFLGVLAIYTRESHEFGREEVEFFGTLASQASIAIRNSRLYEKLKTSNETLEKTLEIKSVLTGVMAHELKTPIQVIMGAAGLLSMGMCGDLSDEQRRRIETIEGGADELLQLIDSSLQMARLEQGQVHLRVTEICSRSLLAELESEFQSKFQNKGVELNIQAPPPGFFLKSDRIKLKEILRNLIDNARKFTPSGSVTVTFANQENNRAEIMVSDTGIGIDKEILPKIFEAFYQVDPRHKEHAGAGLGLNIVKRLVAALSGEIEATSEVGRGTTFRITLPRVISEPEPQNAAATEYLN